jgi:hypothetical protein
VHQAVGKGLKQAKGNIDNLSPGQLHSQIQNAARNNPAHKLDDMAREHLKSLGSKALKAVKKMQD